jgi:hypothetical protein
MPRRIDVTGQRFGRLVAIEYVRAQQCKSKDTHQTKSIWRFKCDCGNIIERKLAHVKNGDTRSCGCLRDELFYKRLCDTVLLPSGESSFNGLYNSCRRGAIGRGYIWNISKDQFREITKKNCAYCGCPPINEFRSNVSSNGTYKYSGVDRIDSTMGYEIDNVVPCCWKCNRAKSTMPVNEFLLWAKSVFMFQNNRNIYEQIP